jgi:flagellar biosynthesis/type III secretory pathway protein FliH
MSSSDRTPAPWALEELDVDSLFPTLPDDGAIGDTATEAHGRLAEDADALPMSDGAHLEALLAEREAAAYARGVQDGRAAAGQALGARVAEAAAAVEGALEAVRAHEHRWLQNVEENVAAIATAVARHILDAELTTSPDAVVALVQRALANFPLDRQVTVRLHPDDVLTVEAAIGSDGTRDGTREVRWFADPHIARGGCLVEGRERVLDGRIDTALERAYRALGQVQA